MSWRRKIFVRILDVKKFLHTDIRGIDIHRNVKKRSLRNWLAKILVALSKTPNVVKHRNNIQRHLRLCNSKSERCKEIKQLLCGKVLPYQSKLKGCVCYIFASPFFMSKIEHL